MQLDHDHHQVRAPTVHVPQQLAEGDIVFKIQNIAEGHDLRGVVVEHQQRACEHERDVDVERHAAHAPSVLVSHRVAIDFGRMQVQEDVGEHAQCAAARRLVVLHAQHRLPEVGLLRLFERFDLFGRALAHHLAALQ